MRAFILPLSLCAVVGIADGVACGSSNVNIEPPPRGPIGPDQPIIFGAPCTGAFQVVDGTGWAVCYEGTWQYSTTDPGYATYTGTTSGGDATTSGDATSSGDGTSGGDTSTTTGTDGSTKDTSTTTTTGSDSASGTAGG
jgi:hypothetical protein